MDVTNYADEVIAIRALNFARKMHEGQTRKDGSPYEHHVFRVGAYARNAGLDVPGIVVAYLHDTREDQRERLVAEAERRYGSVPATEHDECIDRLLAERFHRDVPRLLWGLTDDPGWKRFSPRQRKALQAQKVRFCDDRVRVVKLCDVLDNTEACLAGGPEHWRSPQVFREYIEGNYRVAEACFGLSHDLDARFRRTYEKARRLHFDRVAPQSSSF